MRKKDKEKREESTAKKILKKIFGTVLLSSFGAIFIVVIIFILIVYSLMNKSENSSRDDFNNEQEYVPIVLNGMEIPSSQINIRENRISRITGNNNGSWGTYQRENKTYTLWFQNYSNGNLVLEGASKENPNWDKYTTGISIQTVYAILASSRGDTTTPLEAGEGKYSYAGLYKRGTTENFNWAINRLKMNIPIIIQGKFTNSSNHAIIIIDINESEEMLLIDPWHNGDTSMSNFAGNYSLGKSGWYSKAAIVEIINTIMSNDITTDDNCILSVE